ncbi:MAG: hypothetical protein ACXIUL_00285 [Wenzhouxiangella sp.]
MMPRNVLTALALVTLLAACGGDNGDESPAAAPTMAGPGDFGQADWGEGPQTITDLRCEFSANDLIMTGAGDGFGVRVSFLGEEGEGPTAVNFTSPGRVDLSFSPEHEWSRARFAMSASLGEMGDISGDAQSVSGQIGLRAGNAEAMEVSPDGLPLVLDLRCP